MSVSQKIFNFLHSSPKTSHLKVRDLNVFFKESINPTYKLITLDNVESLELQLESYEKEYNLVAYIVRNGTESDIILGTFESKKEAENALHKVKNKLFGGGKTLLTMANGVVLALIYGSVLFGFLSSLKPHDNGASLNASSMSNMNFSGLTSGNANANGGNVNMADMSKIQKQLLQQALQQAAQQGITPGGSAPAGSGLPNSGALMNNIVADAIQQSQGQSPVDGQPAPVAQTTNAPTTVQAVERPSTAGDSLLNQIK